MKKYAPFLLSVGLFLLGCSKDNNTDVPGPNGPNPDPSADVVVQDFMWKAMNLWYFWQADVPNLTDDHFATNADYTKFLESESNPEDFFFKQLTYTDDRFSFLSDDYVELTQNLSGISKSNGLEFGLTYFDDNNNNMLDANEESSVMSAT